MTREEFEAKARTGEGVGSLFDDGYLVIESCGPECGYKKCGGWRIVRVDHLAGLS